ncbi:MAG: leucyl aminopeptidase, partial [Nitrospirota bacterium]|nr:leucyl aminopeptidase [Nitrospirota bacterium]
MKIMQVKVQVGRAETAATEVLVVTHCEGEGLAKQDAALLDRALGGSLRKLVQSKEFEGKANEVLLYHTQGKVPAKRLVLVGLGKKNEVTLETIRQAMGSAAKRVRQAKAGSFTVVLPTVMPGGMSLVEVAQAMVEGAILGSYQFTAYRSETASGQDVAGMRILIQQKGQLRQVTEGVR